MVALRDKKCSRLSKSLPTSFGDMLGQLELNSYTDRLLGYVQALDKNYVFNNYWKMSRLERKTANEKEPGIVQKHFLYIASFGTKTINSRFLGAAKVYGCLINSKLLPLQQIIPGSVDTAPNNCELKKTVLFITGTSRPQWAMVNVTNSVPS